VQANVAILLRMAPNFLLRHGESLANVAGLIASDPANAGAQYGLTPHGRDQVRRSVEAARAEGTLAGARRVVTSPLLRARESAEIAAEILGAELHVDARLSERGFGEFELLSDHSYEQVWSADRDDPTHERWGVESAASVLARARALLAELDALPADGPVVLCTHGDVASVLLCACAGVPLGQHRDVGSLGNAEVRRLPEGAG
jgi:broad specificity phosphatase PhoE